MASLAVAPDRMVEWWGVGLGNRRSRESANMERCGKSVAFMFLALTAMVPKA
jgi:hypothetical protein